MQLAMHLPPQVAPRTASVPEKGVAVVLALRPVSQIMNPHHCCRTTQTNEGTKPDTDPFEP